jgi:hypothetical protein
MFQRVLSKLPFFQSDEKRERIEKETKRNEKEKSINDAFDDFSKGGRDKESARRLLESLGQIWRSHPGLSAPETRSLILFSIPFSLFSLSISLSLSIAHKHTLAVSLSLIYMHSFFICIYIYIEREIYTYMFQSPVGTQRRLWREVNIAENLRKKHDMLSMRLEEDTNSNTNALRTSWTRHAKWRRIN